MYEKEMLTALNRILQVLGGDCEQGIPIPESDMSGVGARTFIRQTQFDGTFLARPPTQPFLANNLSCPGTSLHFARALDVAGNPIDARIRVWFSKPPTSSAAAPNNGDYEVMRSGQWLKRRRGFQDCYITADDAAVDVYPIIKISADPSYELHGCCNDDPSEADLNLLHEEDSSGQAWNTGGANVTIATVTIPAGGAGVWLLGASAYVFGAGGIAADLWGCIAAIAVNGNPIAGALEQIGGVQSSIQSVLSMTAIATLADGDVIEFIVSDVQPGTGASISSGFDRSLTAVRVGSV